MIFEQASKEVCVSISLKQIIDTMCAIVSENSRLCVLIVLLLCEMKKPLLEGSKQIEYKF